MGEVEKKMQTETFDVEVQYCDPNDCLHDCVQSGYNNCTAELSARTTVISCVIPARIRSACRVLSFWVRRPARQRLSLMWLISLSTTVLIL